MATRVTTEIAESLVQYAATGRVTAEIAEVLVTFPLAGATMGQTFTDKLFLGSTTTSPSYSTGSIPPSGTGNAGDLYIDTTTGTLYTSDGTAWTATLAGSIDLTSQVTGVLPLANGGTNISSVNANAVLTVNPTASAFQGTNL
jgi:hypothetical protein